jgi:hypothetical protein
MSVHRFETLLGVTCAKLGVVTALVACAACTVAQSSEPTSESELSATDAGTVSISGTTQTSDGRPIAGVMVCFRPAPSGAEDASCTMSDDDGAWKLVGAPSRTFIAIIFTKDGFFPALNPITTGTSDLTMSPGDGTLIPST